MKGVKRTIRAEDAVIIFLAAFCLYNVIGVILASFMDTESTAYIFVSYAVPQVCYIGVAAVYLLLVKIDFRFLPQKTDVFPLHYAVAVGLSVGLFFFALLPNYGINLLFSLMGKKPAVTLPDLSSPLNIVLAALIICVLPAIGEELIFRKVLVDGFSEYGVSLAIILSGVLFSLSHLNLAQTVHQLFLGCMLSYLYVKTKNITLTVIVHFINNSLALFLPLFTGETTWNNLTVLGISFAAGGVILAINLIYLIKKVKKIPRASEEERKKPSVFTIGTVAIMAVLWLVAAIVI